MQNAHAYARDRNSDADLRTLALDVATSPNVRAGQLSAAEVAACLAGVVSYIQNNLSMQEARTACAELVRHAPAWGSKFGSLPLAGGYVSEPVLLLAVACRGLLEVAQVVTLRAALSFWATETDPAAWQRLFAA